MSPAPAALLLAALAAAALLADRIVSVAAIALVLLLVCLRAPGGRRRMYLVGALGSGLAVFVLTPFVSSIGWPATNRISSSTFWRASPDVNGSAAGRSMCT